MVRLSTGTPGDIQRVVEASVDCFLSVTRIRPLGSIPSEETLNDIHSSLLVSAPVHGLSGNGPGRFVGRCNATTAPAEPGTGFPSRVDGWTV
ncbi:hypothetical protein D3C76_583420 [compost metagenome]